MILLSPSDNLQIKPTLALPPSVFDMARLEGVRGHKGRRFSSLGLSFREPNGVFINLLIPLKMRSEPLL